MNICLRKLIAKALISSSSIMLIGCQTPTGRVNSQDLINGSTQVSASNSLTLLIGTQAQGAYTLKGKPLTPVFHWHTNKDFPTPISAIAIAADAPIAITSTQDRLVIWDSVTGQAKHYLSAPATITSIAINNEGTLAAMGLTNNTAVLINLVKGGVVNTYPHQSPVLSVDIKGQYLLTGEEANQACLWQIDQTTAIKTFGHKDGVNLVAFGPNNVLVTSGRYDAIRFWDQNSGKQQLAISSSAKTLAAGRRAIGIIFESNKNVMIGFSDSTIERIDFTTGNPIKKWRLDASTPFTKSGASLVGLNQIDAMIYGITSDSRAHQILD